MEKNLLGIDTGGTFTDFVLIAGNKVITHKVLSTPDAPEQAIFKGIHDLGLAAMLASGRLIIVHGTTVATNAALQQKGAKTAYITNQGLADVLNIGRQTRSELYHLKPSKPTIPLPDALTFEVATRRSAQGELLAELDEPSLDYLVDQINQAKPEAVAINLLFSFLNDSEEKRIQDKLSPTYFVSRSSFVLPEYREYERGIATWMNASLGPLLSNYLNKLSDALAPNAVTIMQSSGLTIAADQAAKRGINLLLSGPAGGLSAARSQVQATKLITFDMGGTSTDVSLIDDDIKITNQGHIAGLPIAIPMADIHTIGAGGGSIAYVDQGGILQVGPLSAGASPGPACYGLGGTKATVTDANVVLKRLPSSQLLAGSMAIDDSKALTAISLIGKQLNLSPKQTAEGIIAIANEHMAQALRLISIQRGFDPREFTLACFGGAGGLHLCDLAEMLEITTAIVPLNSGVLSALGMLCAQPGRELVKTKLSLLETLQEKQIQQWLEDLFQQGSRELLEEGVVNVSQQASLDLRYQGQTHTLNVPFSTISACQSEFQLQHKARYGHQLNQPIELLNIRLRLSSPSRIALPDPQKLNRDRLPGAEITSLELPADSDDLQTVQRKDLIQDDTLHGPVLITEDHTLTRVKENWTAKQTASGSLLLRREII
ncbi:MAG: hydantoinase/oxoprolinase family protein [Gammaproteobacteria bacterium]|jgi:N-methylhydantoinase A|nr:hydantoinase/oxoprolinase family protein [Gammaproteobacteria bacterium]MBT6246058.1 hydantoinase/oxoprolinase family protein [Gammaproteobacteria bacterium]